MSIIKEKIYAILQRKSLNIYQLSKLMDFSEGALNKMIKGNSPFSPKAVTKILPILEISREEFESWIIADKYSKEVLELAIKNKKDFPYKRKSMLTVKIDAVLLEKGISRTVLSKKINYSQSGLNRMIIGQINMSKSVIERISEVLEISQDEILSWIMADNYSLMLLESALRLI